MFEERKTHMNQISQTSNRAYLGAFYMVLAGITFAIINAITDALSPLGIRDVAMPATPQTVWRAIQSASKPRSART